MIGKIGSVDLESSQKHLLEELFKVIKYTHKRQQDLLIFAQKGNKDNYDENYMTKDELRAKAKAEREAQSKNEKIKSTFESSSEDEEQKIKLPSINNNKYPNLSLRTEDYFNNAIEIAFNNKYQQLIEESKENFINKQK